MDIDYAMNKGVGFPVATGICCALAVAVVGGRAGFGLCYKVAGLAANVMGANGSEWDQAGDRYLTLAKKNAVRDLTTAVGLLAMGFVGGYVEKTFAGKNLAEPKKDVNPLWGLLAGFGIATPLAILRARYIQRLETRRNEWIKEVTGTTKTTEN